MMPIRIAESVAILASVLLLVGVGHADDVDEFVGFQDEPLPVPFEPQYEFPDSVSIPVILPRNFPDSALALEDESTSFSAPFKRGRYTHSELLKRSSFNRLIQRLLAMRGDRTSNTRVSPVRFAAGRR